MKAVRICQFADDDNVKEAVHDQVCNQQKTFFSSGIKKLADHWVKCM
jgi:hypothetical protein